MKKMNKQFLLAAAAIGFSSAISASDAVGPGDSDARWVLGVTTTTFNNLYEGEDSETYIAPNFEYNGDTFWVKDGALNVSVGQWGSWSGGLTATIDGSFLSDSDDYKRNKMLAGLEERDNTVSGGFYINHSTDYGRLKLALVTDLSSEHNGHEALLKYTFDMKAGDWFINPVIGVQWISDKKVNHFYGVNESEARPAGADFPQSTFVREAYEGDSAFNAFVGIRGRYEFTENWDINLSAGASYMDSTITDSSIVDDDLVYQASATISYNF